MEPLRAQCRAGDTAACIDALLIYRDGTARDPLLEADLLESACTGGFSWACLELGRRAWPDQPEAARDAWRRSCGIAPNGYNCGLAGGTWPADPPPPPALPPAFSAALAAAHLSFRLPARFEPVPPATCGGLAAQWGMRDSTGSVEVHYAIRPASPDGGYDGYLAQIRAISARPDRLGPPQPLPDPPHRVEFGTDAAYMVAFPPDPACTQAPLGAALLLSREGRGEAIVVVWFSQPQLHDRVWPAAFHALRFSEEGWPW